MNREDYLDREFDHNSQVMNVTDGYGRTCRVSREMAEGAGDDWRRWARMALASQPKPPRHLWPLLPHEASDRPAPEPEDPPLVAEDVIGYRVWKTTRDWKTKVWPCFSPGKRLGPVAVEMPPWAPGVNVNHHGACHRLICACGLHGYFDIEEAKRHNAGSKPVLGAIAAWGKLNVQSNGFRAQYAQILGLMEPVSHSMARHYGVPVFDRRSDLEQFAMSHGSGIKNLRPAFGVPVWRAAATRSQRALNQRDLERMYRQGLPWGR